MPRKVLYPKVLYYDRILMHNHNKAPFIIRHLFICSMGNNNRSQHPTDHNKESSRSHAILQVSWVIGFREFNTLISLQIFMIEFSQNSFLQLFRIYPIKQVRQYPWIIVPNILLEPSLRIVSNEIYYDLAHSVWMDGQNDIWVDTVSAALKIILNK